MDRHRRAEGLVPLGPVEFHILLGLVEGERHGSAACSEAQ